MDLVCPVCRKVYEVGACSRCSTDLSLLLKTQAQARELVDRARLVEQEDASRAESLYRQALALWPDVPGATKGLSKLPLEKASDAAPKAAATVEEQMQKQAVPPPRRFGMFNILVVCMCALLVIGWVATWLSYQAKVRVTGDRVVSVLGQLTEAESKLIELKAQSKQAQDRNAELSRQLDDLAHEASQVTTLYDAYKVLRTGDLDPLLRDPSRFLQLETAGNLPAEDRVVLERARKWGAIELLEAAEAVRADEIRAQLLWASIALWPTGYQVDDAYFGLAEIMEKTDPEEALQLYQNVLNIPHGWWYHDDAMYRIGRIHHRLGEIDKAVAVYLQVHDQYPGTEGDRLAQLAMRRLGIALPNNSQ